MTSLTSEIENYLQYAQTQKRLDPKTLKAYRIDLTQFSNNIPIQEVSAITSDLLEKYIGELHEKFKPKTSKRKIASIKAFFHYLEYREIIAASPFNRIRVNFREPVTLPKTIPLNTIEQLLATIYKQYNISTSGTRRKCILRDIAVIELLFATGMRISELCHLAPSDVNLQENIILIFGKGAKERKIQIGNPSVLNILKKYEHCYWDEIQQSHYFFVNKSGFPLSDQSVRRMINRYTTKANIDIHITPHMLRHTFASSLLDADVDIRYIQEMLGHSSIKTTQIYTHVTLAKQKDILTSKHPRNSFSID